MSIHRVRVLQVHRTALHCKKKKKHTERACTYREGFMAEPGMSAAEEKAAAAAASPPSVPTAVEVAPPPHQPAAAAPHYQRRAPQPGHAQPPRVDVVRARARAAARCAARARASRGSQRAAPRAGGGKGERVAALKEEDPPPRPLSGRCLAECAPLLYASTPRCASAWPCFGATLSGAPQRGPSSHTPSAYHSHYHSDIPRD